MQKNINIWLLPLLSILSNGFLGWLINQLPSKQDLNIKDSIIFIWTLVCVIALFILNLQSTNFQQTSVSRNYAWISGFVPLLGGFFLYGILINQILPRTLNPTILSLSLFLVCFGSVLPPVMLLPYKWRKRVILWSFPALACVMVVNSLLTYQWIKVGIWLFLTGFLMQLPLFGTFFYGVGIRIKEQIKQRLEQFEPIVAGYILDKLWELTSTFQKEYYQDIIYTCRDYQTQGLDKDRILKLEKVFVPLKIVAKEATKINFGLIPQERKEVHQSKQKTIWDFLAVMASDSSFRHMAILGVPGSGKTTLLRHLALIYATKQQHKQHQNSPNFIPVLLYLREVRQEIIVDKLSLAELVTKQVKQKRKIQPLNPPDNWFAEKLCKNKCLVMLDGLDEVADETQRRQVSRWVDQQMQTYPDTTFILTSRPFGYKTASLQQEVTVLEVQPFNLEQMERFIHSWYLQTEVMSRAGEHDLGVQEEAKREAYNLIQRIKNSKPLADMAVNPLLLTMIATVHRRGSALPGKRVELYKEICKVLLEKRQVAKNLVEKLTATQKQSLLQVLALELMQANTREFQISEKIPLIQNQLAGITGSGVSHEYFIQEISNVSGLLVEKELGIYEFAHLSFQEYLAAVEIKESNSEKILISKLQQSWWAETIRLYAAQSNASNLIRTILSISNPSVEMMALAYDFLIEGLIIDSDIRQQLENNLDSDLENL
ncbi:NACHT domain-containing protein [Dendronalium sp. ChiSLP03b]|uniref:NACHT domain-containing protein n=1 Tax=Dendronalium sp. ChiSLP03b TaxID=3075381 RepID=UPI00391C49D9